MDQLTKQAISATLHCLTGCAIGEVLGMVIGTSIGLSEWLTVALSVTLAFFFGYSLTFWPILRTGLSLKKALKATFIADTASIASMEIVDNAIMLIIPGAIAAGIASGLFWGSLAFSLAIAFIVTVPLNRFLIKRGLGHATVHEMHGHEHHH
jgi:hypothetical protein